MSDALVAGGPNALASRMADALSDVLHARVRYQHRLEENFEPGVAICATAESFTADSLVLAFADGMRKVPSLDDVERRLALATLAEAATLGRYVAVIASKEASARWEKEIKSSGLPDSRPLRRVCVVGETASGTDLAANLAAALQLPFLPAEGTEHDADIEEPETEQRRVDILAGAPEWLAFTRSRAALKTLSQNADLILHLDLPDPAAPEMSTAGISLPGRLLLKAVRKSSAAITTPAVRHELSEVAHRVPILCIRNEAERRAVFEAFIRQSEQPRP